MEENKDNLQELLVGKLAKAVTATYDARVEQASEGVLSRASELPRQKQEGLFARLVNSFSRPKPTHHEASMSMR